SFSTLARPSGKLLSVIVTLNDVHIGETICGFDSKHPKRKPVLHNESGRIPYAEMMSRNAIAEIEELNPDAVLIKGDLTDSGRPDELQQFLKLWGKFGNKLHWVCGNHDVHTVRPPNAIRMQRIDQAGIILAMLDTSIEGKATGQFSDDQLAWLENIAKTAEHPVMVFGHHHIWNPKAKRDPNFFGINPNDSEKLIELFQKYKCFAGYFAGHTHSNHVEFVDGLPEVPFVECASVKEFPGAWDEYRIYEHGIEQIMHRITAKESLRWEELTSKLEAGHYEQRHFGKLKDRCFTILPRQ
ncbi:MAG: metallophosphoesterase, partial [Candidatus Obscuribacterales bacterium]|nr:metallophosphoesterase [Candidatus Obscuribacterales bacterium]